MTDAKGAVTEQDIDGAVKNRLLLKLRKATHYMPDGKKAQTPSVIGKVLGDAQLLELWAHLAGAKKTGKPVYDKMAYKIQEDWGLLPDLSRWHVSRAVMFFEQRIFGLLGIVESDPELGEWTETKKKAIDKIIDSVDGMSTLASAIQLQMDRINAAHENEKRLKVNLTHVHKEIKALNSLIDTFLHYQIELGLVQRQPMKFDLTLKNGFDAHKRQVDQSVGREPMLQAGAKFLDMIKGKDDSFEIKEIEG